jgi:predicted secreted Zn-dependent protease
VTIQKLRARFAVLFFVFALLSAPNIPLAAAPAFVENEETWVFLPVVTSYQPPATLDTVTFTNATARFYTVTGETANQIRNSLNQNRPGSYDAYAAWNFQWNGCGQDFQVTYTITVDFPEWSPPAAPDDDLVRNWNRYINALALHEQGHVDLVVDSIPYFIETMQNAPCNQVNATGQQLLDEINQINVQYDEETNHGETQGAIFP